MQHMQLLQANIYEQDFMQEREDRARAHSMLEDVRAQIRRLEEELQNLRHRQLNSSRGEANNNHGEKAVFSCQEMDAVRAERAALQAERDAVQADRNAVQVERDAVQAKRAAMQVERDAALREVNSLRMRAGDLQRELDKKKREVSSVWN